MLPEDMIASFERLHRLSVTIHDLDGTLSAGMAVARRGHQHPVCHAVKSSGAQHLCTAFDVKRLRSEAPHLPDGRIQVCPAGLVEWVIPVLSGNRPTFILFAGARAPGDLPGVVKARRQVHPVHDLPTVDLAQATDLLEALRQLAARLAAWAVAHHTTATGAESIALTRTKRIAAFIALHHTRPLPLAALARHLGLSPSRTSHEVRQLCGSSFNDLLRVARLATAFDLVRYTDLPIATVAARSGFSDPSHFFRAFRAHYGATPRKLRLLQTGP